MIRTALRTTALTAAVVLATALPAHAGRLKVADAPADVWGSAETDNPVAIGTRVNGDLTKVLVRHTQGKLVVKATYADLAKNDDVFLFVFYLFTDTGIKRGLNVTAAARARKGESELTQGTGEKKLPCKGLTHGIDYAKNTVTVSVPRACLENPRWVRLQLGALTYGESGFTIDDALTANAEPKTWTKKVKVG